MRIYYIECIIPTLLEYNVHNNIIICPFWTRNIVGIHVKRNNYVHTTYYDTHNVIPLHIINIIII